MHATTKARALTAGLTEALHRVNGRVYKAIAPSAATVSTMTITATLNVKHVCRESMAIALSLVDGDGPLSVRGKAPRKKRTPATFFNQITLNHGTKSVKVFKNGRMHVTGCTTPTQFLDVAGKVCTMMTDVAGIDANDGSGAVGVVDFAVNMINMNFGVDAVLPLQALQAKCTALGYVASYDSDTYPGLNVKLPVGDRRITALVFKSGKVIITGAKEPAELEQAHAMITEVLDATLQLALFS